MVLQLTMLRKRTSDLDGCISVKEKCQLYTRFNLGLFKGTTPQGPELVYLVRRNQKLTHISCYMSLVRMRVVGSHVRNAVHVYISHRSISTLLITPGPINLPKALAVINSTVLEAVLRVTRGVAVD